MERSLLLTELEKDDRVVTMGTSVCQTLGGGGGRQKTRKLHQYQYCIAVPF